MAWTQSDLDALKAAVGLGVLTVRYNDRTVTYQNLTEMRALLAEMNRQITAAPNQRFFATSKGV